MIVSKSSISIQKRNIFPEMDAIRKKMQSLKSETDGLYKTISGFEEATREAAARADQVRLYTSVCSEEFSYSGH